MKEQQKGEKEKYERAKKRIDELKSFYSHLFVYLAVNAGLFLLNILTSPRHLWFYWPLIGWGIGLAIHGLSVFGTQRFLGKDWEERKIKELMDRDGEWAYSINGNTLAYLTNPKVKSHMASTPKVASTDSVMLLDAPWNSLYGYDLAVTNNVPSDLTKGTLTTASALIYGDFSQLLIGFHSAVDVLVDPYTGGSTGAVRIRVMQEMDIAVRHAQSFAACLDIDA